MICQKEAIWFSKIGTQKQKDLETEFVEKYSYDTKMTMYPILNCMILRKNKETESFPTVRDAPPLRFGLFWKVSLFFFIMNQIWTFKTKRE